MTFHKYLGDSKMFEYDKHYRECQQSNKPFIKSRINPSHGNFYVLLDLMTCNYNLSKIEQAEIKKLILSEIKFMESSSRKFNDFNIDSETSWFDGISAEHVHDFCESLYDLTQKYHN